MKKIFLLTLSLTTLSCSQPTTEQPIQTTNESTSLTAKPKTMNWKTEVSAQEAQNLIEQNQENQNFAILDIRTPQEYNDYHISGAINIDFYDAAVFTSTLESLDRSKTYLVHCRSGSRSGASMSEFEALGFENIYHLTRGMNDWENQGLPVIK